MPELAKWVNGQRYDGGRLSPEQRDLRAFYARLVRLAGEPAFRDGDFFPLNPANIQNERFGRLAGETASGHFAEYRIPAQHRPQRRPFSSGHQSAPHGDASGRANPAFARGAGGAGDRRGRPMAILRTALHAGVAGRGGTECRSRGHSRDPRTHAILLRSHAPSPRAGLAQDQRAGIGAFTPLPVLIPASFSPLPGVPG